MQRETFWTKFWLQKNLLHIFIIIGPVMINEHNV